MKSTLFPIAMIAATAWNLLLLLPSSSNAWVPFVFPHRSCSRRHPYILSHRFETSTSTTASTTASTTTTTTVGSRLTLAATSMKQQQQQQQPLQNNNNNNNNEDERRMVSSRRAWFSQITRQVVAATAATTTAAAAASAPLLSYPLSSQAAMMTTATTTAAVPIVSTSHTCDPSVSVWVNSSTGRTIYLLGTAHISTSSAMLAGDLVDDVRPNAVFVELDAKRVGMTSSKSTSGTSSTTSASSTSTSGMAAASTSSETTTATTTTNKAITVSAPTGSIISGPSLADAASNPSDQKVMTSSKPNNNNNNNNSNSGSNGGGGGGMSMAIGSAAIGSAIKGMYGNLADQGFRPGEEFVIAIQHGQALGATIILGDRDVDVTLQRLSTALRQTDIRKLLSADSELEATMKELLPKGNGDATTTTTMTPLSPDSPSFSSDLSVYVETMKAKENVRAIMAGLQKVAPEIYQAMVSERDEYMAHGLDVISATTTTTTSTTSTTTQATAPFPVIVAVMGIAHTQGVEQYLQAHGWTPATTGKQLKCPSTV